MALLVREANIALAAVTSSGFTGPLPAGYRVGWPYGIPVGPNA
ncbi:MAG TPA: hypothetical protein VGG39_02705 [Polyangiaceae bacterium]|jgi:hypothetical protein